MTADLVDCGADAEPDPACSAALGDAVCQDLLSRRSAGEEDEARRVSFHKVCALLDQSAAALETERWAVMSHARQPIARA
jgi:hypothetical protein